MKKETLIQAYIANSLTDEQQKQLERLIEEGEVQLEELDSMDLFDQLNSELTVTNEVDQAIHNSLKTKPNSTSTSDSINWYKYALMSVLGLLLLAAVFWFGKQSSISMDSDAPIFKQDFASQFIEAENASEKITLVSTENLDLSEDMKIADALIFALNNDKSTNVRIACVQTLERYSYLEQVRTGLVNSIVNQDSPLVLSHIADAINASGKGLSKEEMAKRINKDLPPPLLDHIQENFLKI